MHPTMYIVPTDDRKFFRKSREANCSKTVPNSHSTAVRTHFSIELLKRCRQVSVSRMMRSAKVLIKWICWVTIVNKRRSISSGEIWSFCHEVQHSAYTQQGRIDRSHMSILRRPVPCLHILLDMANASVLCTAPPSLKKNQLK